MSITSIANLIGILSIGKETEYIYNLYADKGSLIEASHIHYFGLIGLVTGFQLGKGKNWLPSISYKLNDPKMDSRLFILNIIFFILVVRRSIPGFLGAIRSFIENFPLFSSFYFVRKGILDKLPRLFIFGVILVILLATYAVLYSYLRSEMIKPVIFFLLAYLIANKNIKVLFQLKLVPAYVFAVVFISYFGIFGAERSNIGEGTRRIEELVELKESQTIEGQTPIARATNFNQLSQVVRLTKEDGFLNGETLQYMTYVFIPRFIWPGKPIIQTGAWFAEKIGLGWIDYEGKYHNSVNMTIPGELYLNYGYSGVIIGSLFVGLFFCLLWNSVRTWEDQDDLFANLFAAYLLFLGFFTLGADIQIVVTLLAIYLILLFLNKVVFRNAS
jgi:hypothetical protein